MIEIGLSKIDSYNIKIYENDRERESKRYREKLR